MTRESVATLERALDLGVTLLDTSMSYGRGHNERLLARVLATRRDAAIGFAYAPGVVSHGSAPTPIDR